MLSHILTIKTAAVHHAQCRFHGKPPSKNKQEERQRKYLEEVAIAKATTSEDPSAELDRLKALQRSTGSAYIPLTGGWRGSGGFYGL